jgi:hypothetical protein
MATTHVTITLKDQDYSHDMIDVYAEEVLESNDVNSAAGSFQEIIFETTVADGQLNLRIRDDGGTDLNWVINALTIVVASPCQVETTNHRKNCITSIFLLNKFAQKWSK